MALTALTNAKIMAGAADLSGYTNSVELSAEAEEHDVTTFGNAGWRARLGGMKTTTINASGFWDAGSAALPDDRMFGDFGATGVPMTVAVTPTVGDVSYFTRVARLNYTFGAEVGEVLPFESEASGDGTTLVRGLVADNQARTATGTSGVLTLVVPTATTRPYAAIHVVAVSGTAPSMTVALQGDNAGGFPSPATIATSAPITAPGWIWLQGAYGASADAFYRLSYTISGTSPSFTVVASVGVGS